jgi:multicomponent Na+:H+ antiporter subunit G
MLASLVPWLADALVILGLLVMTISLVGVLRMPELYTSLHAWSKATVLGVAPLLLAAGVESQTILLRGLLVLGFLVLTAPVSSHVIARAHWRKGQRAAIAGDTPAGEVRAAAPHETPGSSAPQSTSPD